MRARLHDVASLQSRSHDTLFVCRILADLMIPEGAHHREEDVTIFFVPSVAPDGMDQVMTCCLDLPRHFSLAVSVSVVITHC